MATAPLHIVFIGYDDTVFSAEAPSDTRLRHEEYATLLCERRPGSRLTVLVLTHRSHLIPVSEGNVTFVPVSGWRGTRLARLFVQLISQAKRQRLKVISPQSLDGAAWVSLLAARVTGAKVVGQVHFDIFSEHARRDQYGSGLGGKARALLAFRMVSRMQAVRVVSEGLRAEFARRRLSPDAAVAPLPVTMLTTLAPVVGERPKNPARVLFVGRLAPEKHLEFWLRVASRISRQEPSVEFEWIGDGRLRSELSAKAEKLGLGERLHLAGALPYEQLANIYQRASVFLLTSHYEGFGRVLVEAGWQGLPVVAPRISGVNDIVCPEETGILCAPGDESEFANAVLRLLRDPALCARMGRAAQMRVKQKFDPHLLAQQWVDLLVYAAEATV